MSNRAQHFDVAIIGGGLAGLSLSILLAKKNISVVLFEQKNYPFHRVCGEYIAMESYDFLQRLGLNLTRLHQQLPRIKRIQVTTPTQSIDSPLEPGGFGISRYTIDAQLAQLARQAGVTLMTGTRVKSVKKKQLSTSKGDFSARLLCGAFGKHSNIDRRLRANDLPTATGENTFVGIKYHFKTRFPKDLIALHNFAGGYCGISAIENDTVCCCYLVSQETLSQAGGIAQLEATVLSKNPYLESIFTHATHLWSKPQTIAQVYFSPRVQTLPHMFCLGDAAGLIPPLCGNGMSMAFHSAHLLAPLLQDCLAGKIAEFQALASYTKIWNRQFGSRMHTGRLLQKTFGHIWPINSLISSLRPFPKATQKLISRTHGAAF